MSEYQTLLTVLLRGKKQKHPFSYCPSTSSYKKDLRERLEDFENRLQGFFTKNNGELSRALKKRFNSIERNNELILKCVDEYLNGNSGKAYDTFEKMMKYKVTKDAISELSRELKELCIKPNYLYRVRVSNTPLESRQEMFHIPFNMRHLVGTQRYSIAGLPCLYLGTSIYVCWQEMGKPNLDSLYISSYQLNANSYDTPKFLLDFAYSLETLKKSDPELLFFDGDEPRIELQIAYLVLWPLLLSCSYIKARENANFNVEYIVPNMLLQWITTDAPTVDGIMYLSTKTRQLRQSRVGINVVIPPKFVEGIENNVFCTDMINYLELTKPISWQILETINCNSTGISSDFGRGDDLEEEFIQSYRSTNFFKAEKKIEQILSLAPIKTN
ncbi:TPA: hypothetical protein ACPJ07_001564 [Vibrio diabolicus]